MIRLTILNSIPQADYVLIGDDDIFFIPDNIMLMIGEMKNNNMSSIGCAKEHDPIMRKPWSKYFVPEEFYRQEFYTDYLSGGAFVVTGQLAKQIARVRTEVFLECPFL